MSIVLRSIVAAAAVAAGLAHAGDPVRVEKADLEKILPGKTMSYSNVNGSSTTVYFAADGKATYRGGQGRTSNGTWNVDDEGRYCIKITSGPANDHCRRVWKTDSGYSLGNGKGDFQAVNGLD